MSILAACGLMIRGVEVSFLIIIVMTHIPVLEKETIALLNPRPGENFIDGTGGAGSHTLAILKAIAPGGRVLFVDWDASALERFRKRIQSEEPAFEEKAILVNDNFANVAKIAQRYGFFPADGILLDLGFSSLQVEESGRGFSFKRDEPLDMRYNSKFKNVDLTAGDIVNQYSEGELAEIFRKYGEEKFSRRIAKRIVEERKIKPIRTTFQLVEVIKGAVSYRYRQGRIHPATRTFQALRIATNNELENLERFLPQALEILKPKGGRLAIISFHSLEDRLVKNFFRQAAAAGKLEILTKKPIRPSQAEIRFNPRCRSAKLRAVIRK